MQEGLFIRGFLLYVANVCAPNVQHVNSFLLNSKQHAITPCDHLPDLIDKLIALGCTREGGWDRGKALCYCGA